jgi:hypothetical protein
MSWPSVIWGEIRHSEDVVNEDPIFIFRELGAHLNHSVLGKWEPTTCGGQFLFLWGWWCDIHMTGKAWLQSGHNLYVCPSCWTPCSYLSAQAGLMGTDAMTQTLMVLWFIDIFSKGVDNLLWEGPQIASMPCPIRSPQELRALRKGAVLPWWQTSHRNAFPELSLDTVPDCSQCVPSCPRSFLSMDKRLFLGSGDRKHQFSPANVGDAWRVMRLRGEIWGVHVLGPIFISYRDALHTNQRHL